MSRKPVADRLCSVLVGLLLTARGSLLTGQEPPRYDPGALACAAFQEEVRTSVAARRGMEGWQERGIRTGILVVHALPGAARFDFEAWYDSLAVSWHGRDDLIHPDTDGLVGGRWRGSIAPHGEVVLAERPFIPPELRAVSDLSDALLDFFPPLPTTALSPGGRWTDSLGLEIERLGDSAASDETLERYRWRIRTEGSPAAPDTTVRLRQDIHDEGLVAWSRRRGPIIWRREITVQARIDPARGPRSPVQSRVTQEIFVQRSTGSHRCS